MIKFCIFYSMNLKSIKKKIIRSLFFKTLISALVAFYLILVKWTCRLKVHGIENFHPYWNNKKPLIVVFWHNRMALAPFAWKSSRPFFMLISPHEDGLLISKVIGFFGLKTVFGSSSHHQGPKSLALLIRHLNQGHCVGITPDGPRGPLHVVKPGVFMAAYKAGADVVALSFASSRHKELSSWDRFYIPLPFGKGHLVIGHPVPAPRHCEEKERFITEVEEALSTVTKKALDLLSPPPQVKARPHA
jgi:lysophospholipid acyltransferase (LPLAT)-like uncharacterized protein